MNNLLFQLPFAKNSIEAATKSSMNRRSGTVAETVRHSLIHTVDGGRTTIHHSIIGACPHPVRARAEQGDHYMVGYVSIPIQWYDHITPEIVAYFGISFIGPSGTAQRLPTSMYDYEDILGARMYLGLNWLGHAMAEPALQQPGYPRISALLHECAEAIGAQA